MPKPVPKSVKVFSQKYRIVLDKAQADNDKVFGACRFVSGEILLKPDVSPSMLRETLVHEILEAVVYHQRIKLSHDDLCRLSEGIAAVLADNDIYSLFEHLEKEAV